jgi:hypothetical protein
VTTKPGPRSAGGHRVLAVLDQNGSRQAERERKILISLFEV